MTQEHILRVAINVPLSRQFDYLPPANGLIPAIGCRVQVPFGRRQLIGVVLAHTSESEISEDKIKRCSDILDDEPLLGPHELWLIHFTSQYYHHPIGEVVAAALPTHLRNGKSLHPVVERISITEFANNTDRVALRKRAPRQAELLNVLLEAGPDGIEADHLTLLLPNWRRIAKAILDKSGAENAPIRTFETTALEFDEALPDAKTAAYPLNADQGKVLSAMGAGDKFAAYLLDGVTGSGKTEVYLQRLADVLKRGKQAMVLVPEIGLTPQLVGRFKERLGVEPALLHSGLSDTTRLAAWRAARSGAAHLIVGTRSSIFTPLKNPGLIIVDEEHDHSFKQQEGLRYSARDLAIAKAKHLDIPVILGTATPSLEMLQHCRTGDYQHLRLPARAGAAVPPSLQLIDTVRTPAIGGVSEPLADAVRTHLANDNQVLIYLNRRGFAPTLICASCSFVSGCERCDSRLTVHAASKQLRCHHCGHARRLPSNCDECGEVVKPLGEGTERLEETLTERFPDAVITRIDSDTTQQKGAMSAALESATLGHANILIGTQMLSKGHHFPKLTLVGIVNADQGLFGTDFRSAERMAQSIVQVAGRAGRETRRGEVLIQTAFPENEFWNTLIKGGYPKISAEALAERKITRWPPFTRLAILRSAAHQRADAHDLLELARQHASNNMADSLRILGPVDAPMARKAGRYRAQLLLQSSERASLHHVLRELRALLENHPMARKVRWSIDVDPVELF